MGRTLCKSVDCLASDDGKESALVSGQRGKKLLGILTSSATADHNMAVFAASGGQCPLRPICRRPLINWRSCGAKSAIPNTPMRCAPDAAFEATGLPMTEIHTA